MTHGEKRKESAKFPNRVLSNSHHLWDTLRKTMTMILKMLHDFNILSGGKQNSLSREIYKQYISGLEPVQLKCNNCHHRGYCTRYGFYERNYLLSPADLNSEKIKIQRVKCKDCNTTHALLPEEIVPYSQYSIVFIFLALYQYYVEETTVAHICEGLGITPRVLYRWTHRFEVQKERFLGLLRSMQYSGKAAIQWLLQQDRYGAGIARQHLKQTEKMPMQNHRNPPNTRHPIMC